MVASINNGHHKVSTDENTQYSIDKSIDSEYEKLQEKHRYEKKLFMLFKNKIKKQGVTRNYNKLVRSAKLGLKLEQTYPDNLPIWQLEGISLQNIINGNRQSSIEEVGKIIKSLGKLKK